MALALLTSGRGVATPAAAAGAPAHAHVRMVSFTFKDAVSGTATTTIAAGGTVTWTYDERPASVPPGCESPSFRKPSPVTCPGHSTTSVARRPGGAPLWDSGVHRAAGFPFSTTFPTAGSYRYFCIVHGGPHPNNPATRMNGVVTVVAGPTEAPTPTPRSTPTPAPTPASVGQVAATVVPGTPDTSASGSGTNGLLAGLPLALLATLRAASARRRRGTQRAERRAG